MSVSNPPEDNIREAIFWQLNNLLCNATPEMCQEAREIEAAGSIKDGGRGGASYTLQITHNINELEQLTNVYTTNKIIEELEELLKTHKELGMWSNMREIVERELAELRKIL